MPELEWEPLKLNSVIKDMDSVEFWQQKGLQESHKGKIDAAMDYYRQGLRKNPTDHILIYSLGVCYSKLKKYKSAIHWFSRGIDLLPRWLDGLCGIAIAYFNIHDFERALKFISLAKVNGKGSQLTNSKMNCDLIDFIKATCLKMTNNLKESCSIYCKLEDEFQRSLSRDLISLLWGLVLIPLSDDRKLIADHYNYLQEYLSHLSDCKVTEHQQHLLLSKLCSGTRQVQNYKIGAKACLEFFDYQS